MSDLIDNIRLCVQIFFIHHDFRLLYLLHCGTHSNVRVHVTIFCVEVMLFKSTLCKPHSNGRIHVAFDFDDTTHLTRLGTYSIAQDLTTTTPLLMSVTRLIILQVCKTFHADYRKVQSTLHLAPSEMMLNIQCAVCNSAVVQAHVAPFSISN